MPPVNYLKGEITYPLRMVRVVCIIYKVAVSPSVSMPSFSA